MATEMTLPQLLSALRGLAAIFARKRDRHPKHLEASVLGRWIVAELPEEISLTIQDDRGRLIKGVYAIGVMIWNKGSLPVLASDLLGPAKLQIKIDKKARFVGARILAVEDLLECRTEIVDDQTVAVNFDCINPGEYLIVPLFVSGSPYTDVQIIGRIVGQEQPIDCTAEEVRAPLFERFGCLLILGAMLNAVTGFFVSTYFIWKLQGFSSWPPNLDKLPTYLSLPFGFGLCVWSMFMYSRIDYYLERRKLPKGYPTRGDLEPPLWDNLKGMFVCLIKGKKQRISTSIFDWGKPVIMTRKRVRRRSVNDWVR